MNKSPRLIDSLVKMGYYSIAVQVKKEYTQQKTCGYLETSVLQTNVQTVDKVLVW